MRIKINVDCVGKPINEIVGEKLKEKNLPSCIGNMTPPIVPMVVEMDAEKVIKPQADIPADNIVSSDLSNVVLDLPESLKNYALDADGAQHIMGHKEVTSSEYANHIANCVDCEHKELCDRLTYYYLTTIRILENFRR